MDKIESIAPTDPNTSVNIKQQLNNCEWSPYFLNGFWIVVGIVAGIIIELAIEHFGRKSQKKTIRKQLKFEFECNLRLINEWIQKLLELQAASAADNPQKFTYYFDVSKIFNFVLRRAITEGTVYDFLNFDDLRILLKTEPLISEWGQNELNNKVVEIKSRQISKGDADGTIEFYLTMLRTLNKNISSIHSKL